MATFDPIGLTPLDHITAKVYLPYMLYFNSVDPIAAVRTLQSGINKLVAEAPWLAGDVVIHSKPETRAYIHPSRTAPHDAPMLTVKHFDRDDDFRTHPTQSYLPVPLFIPASQQRPVLRFQANVFPTKIALVMSFMHLVFDGSGGGVVLQALSECCQAAAGEGEAHESPVTQSLSRSAIDLRRQVSDWPSKCQTRLDHSLELGPPAFDSDFSVEQWGAMESALASASTTHRVTISPDKVAQLKALCTELAPQSKQAVDFSTNDIITAVLGISIDRVLHPDQDKQTHIFMVADLRRRISLPLPETYPGNMIYPVWNPIHCEQSSNDSSSFDLLHTASLASQLRTKVLSSINSPLADSVSATVANGTDWFRLEGKPADIVMTSWRHLKVFALSFGPGLGHIDDFESGFALIPGACIVLPRREREVKPNVPVPLPWEVSVTLRPGDYGALVGDPLLRRILAR